MPTPSDSSRSLPARPARSLTHLRVQKTWLQILLVLGFIQVILGVLIVTFSLVAATITPSTKIRHSCPSWAGFSVSLGSRQRVGGVGGVRYCPALPGPCSSLDAEFVAGPRGVQPCCSPTPLPVPAAVHCGRIPRVPPE